MLKGPVRNFKLKFIYLSEFYFEGGWDKANEIYSIKDNFLIILYLTLPDIMPYQNRFSNNNFYIMIPFLFHAHVVCLYKHSFAKIILPVTILVSIWEEWLFKSKWQKNIISFFSW